MNNTDVNYGQARKFHGKTVYNFVTIKFCKTNNSKTLTALYDLDSMFVER